MTKIFWPMNEYAHRSKCSFVSKFKGISISEEIYVKMSFSNKLEKHLIIYCMKIIIICSLVLPIVLLTGCGNKNKELTQSISTDSIQASNTRYNVEQDSVVKDIPIMSGWKCYGLQGRVKSVKYTNGSYLDFNTDGNLVKKREILDSGTSFDEYIYQTPTLYKKIYRDNQDYKPKYKISTKANSRIETLLDGDACDQDIIFVFDKSDRLIEKREESSCDYYYEHTFTYAVESAFLPNKSIEISESYGDGTITTKTEYEYEYVKKDNEGNWLERQATQKITTSTPNWDEPNSEEKEKVRTTSKISIEKREIKYY